jgi:hypothetical protein
VWADSVMKTTKSKRMPRWMMEPCLMVLSFRLNAAIGGLEPTPPEHDQETSKSLRALSTKPKS